MAGTTADLADTKFESEFGKLDLNHEMRWPELPRHAGVEQDRSPKQGAWKIDEPEEIPGIGALGRGGGVISGVEFVRGIHEQIRPLGRRAGGR